MSQALHPLARRQAHRFFEVAWDDLPTAWHTDLALHQFEFELWLASFDTICQEKNLHGFALLKAVRQRAEIYYQRDLRQPHHMLADWGYFRLQLELCLLMTVRASDHELSLYHSWQFLLSSAVFRIGPRGQERLEQPPRDPSSETPF